MKIKKTNIYYRQANVMRLIKPLIKNESNFKIVKTGYSCQIVSEFEKIMISPSRSSTRLFAANQKLSKDIDTAPEIDTIERGRILYYDINARISTGTHVIKNAYCVDIKSAYLSCLFINQIIKEETYFHLSKLTKTDRLKCVGMLATQRVIFKYEKGQLIDYKIESNERRRNYFMLVCQEIGRIMRDISDATADDFLFFWVDGLFFKSKKAADIAMEILTNNGYNFSFDKLKNFEIENREKHAYISFEKDSKRKVYRVSKRNCTFATNHSLKDLINKATTKTYL